MFRRTWPAIFLMISCGFTFGASTTSPDAQLEFLQHRERALFKTLTRASQFASVAHITSRPDCEEVQPPEALATPNPLFTPAARGRRVKVSFIIGTDGHVHSPLILESGGMLGDWHVLRAVRTWRYRPATCNGVPTETEGKIEFSSR